MNRDHLVAWLGLALALGLSALWFEYTLTAAAGFSLALTAALALGVTRDGSLGPYRPWLAAALATWLAAFTLMHVLPDDADRLVLGLPPATAAMMGILWILPLATVVLPYALHFRHIVEEPSP